MALHTSLTPKCFACLTNIGTTLAKPSASVDGVPRPLPKQFTTIISPVLMALNDSPRSGKVHRVICWADG